MKAIDMLHRWHIAFFLLTILPLTAYTSCQNQAITHFNDLVTLLTETVYELLEQGYTIDQIALHLEKLSHQQDQYSPEIQTLITTIAHLFAQQHAKNDVINIIVQNEEAEKFYAQANFRAKVKNYYFMVKSVIILCIILIICYFINRYFYKLNWFTCGFWEKGAKKSQSAHPSITQSSSTNNEKLNTKSQLTQPNQIHNQSNQQPSTNINLSPNNSHHKGDVSQGLVEIAGFNAELYQLLLQQGNQAQHLGLEPTRISSQNSNGLNVVAQRSHRKFNDLIKEQLTYAKEIGLEPSQNVT